MKKLMTLILISLLMGAALIKEVPSSMASTDSWVFDLGQFRESSYHRTLKRWEENHVPYQGSSLVFAISDQLLINPHLSFESDAVLVFRSETLTYQIEVSESRLYHISLNYLIEQSFSTAPTIEFKINDAIPFNEMNGFPLAVSWALEPREESRRFNRFGNELLPYTVSQNVWVESTLTDANRRYNEPFYFYLEAGIHEIQIKSLNQNIMFGDLMLSGQTTTPSYATYQAAHSHHTLISGQKIVIQGQDMISKNDIEIKAGYHKGVQVTPSSFKTNVLNVLSGSSMQRSGTRVDYQLVVPQSGLYYLNFKYLQRDMVGMSSARRISINGEVPFKELEAYLFAYQRQWTNHTLGDSSGYYEFYLEQGTHILSLEVTTSHLIDDIDRLNQVMDMINSLGLAVAQITGNSNDPLIDWDILRFLPTIKEDLLNAADELDEIYENINNLTPEHNRAASVSTLLIASRQLKRLAQFPNRIPNKLSELNIGSGSAYQLIGVAINQMNIQPLTLDHMTFYGEGTKLERANANILSRFWFSLRSFVFSFFDQRYRLTSNPNDDILEVWIGQSSLYLDIMQNMIDDEFTQETGIKVRLSVMPNTQRIILNNATNTNPDVVLSIDSWEPYQYALRGMLSDLSQFDGFEAMVEPYHPNNFTPMIFENGVYGIPETQGISLLFYRKDILSFLGLTPPDTWDDILNMLPILQSYQMNFFHPLGGEGAYKGFGLTAPFIYQFGGEIYHEQGMSTTFNEEANIQAITFMTDIFNIYSLPQQVPSFFEHFRSGSLPLGIASIDLYLQLKYAAPELAGQWGILPIPGMYDDTLGEVARWAPSYGKASILFSKSRMQAEGFELIKWWNQSDTQMRYLETVKMVLGERFIFLPANLVALENSIWDEEVKLQVLEQARWSRIPAITPGSYIVERELTNIWNKIVIDQVNPRVAIDQSIPRINRELQRKYEEFGYIRGGVIVREYIVPRNDNIQNWIP